MKTGRLFELVEALKFVIPALLTLVLFIVLLFGFLLPRTKDLYIARERHFMEQTVNSAVTILQSYHDMVQNSVLAEESARRQAVTILRRLRHGKNMRNYFWIVDKTLRVVMHPYRTELEGEDVSMYQDPQGVFVFREMADVVEEGGQGYVSYLWQYQDERETIEPKLSYVKEFQPWGWIVGSGMYVEVADREISRLTRSMTVVSLVGFVLIFLFSLYLVRSGIVAKRRQYEMMEKLFETENEYKEVVEFMNEGLAVENAKRILTYVNRRFCEMLGYSKEELIGNKAELFLNKENREIHDRQLYLRRKGEKSTYELAWRKKDGDPLYTIVSPQPIFSRKGDFRGSFAAVTDITKRKVMEEELNRSLQEKNALLKEVHHRVKNNLQLIVSLLSLQKTYTDEASLLELITDSQKRIQTMAHVHETLYQSEHFDRIDLSLLVRSVIQDAADLVLGRERHIDFLLDIEDVFLEVHYAIPCGLIVNELVTNAVKYAFPTSNSENKIIVRLEQRKQTLMLEVIDNGIGLPEEVLSDRSRHLGLQLVEILAQQLGGTVSIDGSGGGSHFKIEFNLS